MAKVNMADLKSLRERSGAGLKDCKNALLESNGDMDAAMDWLRAKGIAKAAKNHLVSLLKVWFTLSFLQMQRLVH